MTIKYTWKIIAIVELLSIIVAVLFDIFLPTLVIIGLMFVSIIIRREHISIMGFKHIDNWAGLASVVIIAPFFMQLFDAGLIMPILNRVTGSTIDYSGFAYLQGNIGQLLMLLFFSWTLAAVGEELAYRGYLQKVMGELLGNGIKGILFTSIISSVLFGLAHLEQGIIGVIVTTGDALFYSWLKHRFNNLWAPILAHGLYNTVGVTTFYFTGPIYGLW